MGSSEQVPKLTKTPETIIDLTFPNKPTVSRTLFTSNTHSDKPRLPQTEQDAEQHASDATSSDEREDELDSFYEEMLESTEEFNEDERLTESDTCTLEESLRLRQQLHDVGAEAFVYQTVTAGRYTARKLCTAFNIRPPKYMDSAADEALLPLLGLAIARELTKRRKLPQNNTFDDAVSLLRQSKNIIVVSGAGISTSLGVPDFRSKSNGLYSRLRELDMEEPEEVFAIDRFDEDPTLFYSLAAGILPTHKNWSPTHQFIRLLQDKDKLLTNYTQNIDNVESEAGIMPEKLVQCHGSFATASCRKCKHQVPGPDIFQDIRMKRVPLCKKCSEALQTPQAGLKRKRSSCTINKVRKQRCTEDSDDDGQYDIPQPGVMKPDIVFFGEPLPNHFFTRLTEHDKDLVDLVLVIGTSMMVAPVSELPQFLPADVPHIYISRERAPHVNFDIELLGDCDTIVTELCHRAQWDLKHPMIKSGKSIDVHPFEPYKHVHTIGFSDE